MIVSNEICEMRYDTYKFYNEKKYLECINVGNCLLDKMNNENLKDMDTYWCINYYKTLSNMKLERYEEAYKNAIESLKAMKNYDTNKYNLSLMMVAVVKKQLGDVEKAKSLFFYLSKLFKKRGYKNLRIFCLFNLACMKKEFNILCRLIDITYGTSYDVNDNIEMDKITLLDEMEVELQKIKV